MAENESVLCAAIRSLGANPENILESLIHQRNITFSYFSVTNCREEAVDLGKLITDQTLLIQELKRATGKEVSDGC